MVAHHTCCKAMTRENLVSTCFFVLKDGPSFFALMELVLLVEDLKEDLKEDLLLLLLLLKEDSHESSFN